MLIQIRPRFTKKLFANSYLAVTECVYMYFNFQTQ